MRLTRGSISANLCVVGLLSLGLVACGLDNQGGGAGGNTSQGGSGGGSGGTVSSGGTGSGGTTSTGGTTTSDTGGTVASGGTTRSGGSDESGGTTATGAGGRTGPRGTGGSTASTDTGGEEGEGGSTGRAGTVGGTGGRQGTGGRSGSGGATTPAGTGGSQGTGGGTGTGDCVKGQTKGKEVAIIGESFIDMSTITQELEKNAVAAGSLAANEHYDDNAVSGTTLANDQIPSQYRKAVSDQGFIRYVFMDGGGNDCLINNNGDAALTAATSLFKTMADNKTEKVVYFFYPDPIGNNFANLKTCLDKLRPKMKDICDKLTAPKCYWIDLRETWNGHSEYTQDGIHPTQAGSKATADAIWKSAVANCVAQ